MEKLKKRVTFNLDLNKINTVPAYDETRIPVIIRRKNRNKRITRETTLGEIKQDCQKEEHCVAETTQKKIKQGRHLENEKGEKVFVPINGLFL